MLPQRLSVHMTQKTIQLFLLVLCLCGNLLAADNVALARAQAAFEAGRDDTHRVRMTLKWNDEQVTMPTSLDVIVLRGYLNHDLLHMQWHDDKITASVVRVDRQWFYHRQPNSRTYFVVPMSAGDFRSLWQSISYVLTVDAIEKAKKEATEDEDIYSQQFVAMSSHASYHLFRWCVDDEQSWSSLPVLRGSRYNGDIRDLDDLKMLAITKLLWEYFPKETVAENDNQQIIPRWHMLLRSMLPSMHGDNVSPIAQSSMLLIEDACEILGDIGDETDMMLLNNVEKSLRPAIPPKEGKTISETYYEDKLRGAILNTNQRIQLRLNWNSDQAISIIHENTIGTYTEVDQIRWMRKQFLNNDKDRYRQLLLTDLHSEDSSLIIASINEIREHFTGQHQSDLQPLLHHKDGDVVVTSAMAMLGKPVARYGSHKQKEFKALGELVANDPFARAAMEALSAVAADHDMSISPYREWFNGNARTYAISFLGACPEPWGWDDNRYRQQLNDPLEKDGRVIYELITHLGYPLLSSAANSKPPEVSAADKTRLLGWWGRCLDKPYNKGTILAIEELCAFKDHASIPRIRDILAELRAGCTEFKFADSKKDVIYPWIDKYDLDALDKKFTKLTEAVVSP